MRFGPRTVDAEAQQGRVRERAHNPVNLDRGLPHEQSMNHLAAHTGRGEYGEQVK